LSKISKSGQGQHSVYSVVPARSLGQSDLKKLVAGGKARTQPSSEYIVQFTHTKLFKYFIYTIFLCRFDLFLLHNNKTKPHL
jgi:hypothetical protein